MGKINPYSTICETLHVHVLASWPAVFRTNQQPFDMEKSEAQGGRHRSVELISQFVGLRRIVKTFSEASYVVATVRRDSSLPLMAKV